MKLYYTLVQPFSEDIITNGQDLCVYLTARNIKHHISAEFSRDLEKFGYNVAKDIDLDRLLMKAVVLIEEHDLSAILLSLNHVSMIKNCFRLQFKNKIRGILKKFHIN